MARPATRRPESRGGAALGLDGCPAGWAAVLLVDGSVAATAVVASAGEAVERFRPDAVAVDIPIGLVDGADRDADRAARAVLGRAGASVFNAPPRSVVGAYRDGRLASYRQALALSRSVSGKGLSRQSWSLVPKIAEVDALAQEAPVPVLEVHPEVSFRELADGPLAAKRTWNGLMGRRALLAAVGVDLPEPADGGERCAADDLLDAAVAAWTASGLLDGAELVRLPAGGNQVDRGRAIEIVARRRPPRTGGLPAGSAS